MSNVCFHFQTNDLNVRFQDSLSFYGSCQTFRWDVEHSDFDFHPPVFDGYKIGWSFENGKSVIENFRDYKLNLGHELSSRIPQFESYWSKARASILVIRPGVAHVQFAWPGEGFSEMMMGAISGGLTLGVRLSVGFSKSETAPWPTIDAFLNHQEATFSDRNPAIGAARVS